MVLSQSCKGDSKGLPSSEFKMVVSEVSWACLWVSQS